MAEDSPSEHGLQVLEAALLNKSGSELLHNRFRALFTLKALKCERAVEIISKGFSDPSALLRHELAYCLGQMGNPVALPVLEKVLKDKSENPMVRHEAAEAMGAISSASSLPILKQYLSDSERVVRETCEIAIAKIQWNNSEEGRAHLNSPKDPAARMYTSIDPAPPTSAVLSGRPKPEDASKSNTSKLRATLLDTTQTLFERYRAMFVLRDIGTPTAVDALAAGFADNSALFKCPLPSSCRLYLNSHLTRHEIAFVLGQLLSPASVPALLSVLENSKESVMVRHEAAEALGGIVTPDVLPHLKAWEMREDAPQAVRESCQVAIDMWEHENSGELQNANGLSSKPGVVEL